ncbi:MAG: TonB-dependent receptor [Deltaproteobacteria bacterium]|nr:TonB-dependent receptor [Deltaproteobacteria bacterium]
MLLVDPHPLLDEPGLRADVQAIGALNGRRGTGVVRLDGAPESVDGLAWRLEGNFSKGAALETPDYPLENTGIEEWNAGAAARMRWDDSVVEVSLRHNDLVNGICSCIRNDSPEQFFAQIENQQPNGVELYRVDYDIERPYQDVTHDLAMIRGGTRFAEVGELHSTYAFQTNRRKEYEIVRQAVDGPQFDFQLDTHTLDADFDHSRVTLADGLELSGTWGMSGRFQENVYSGLPLIPNYRSYGAGVFGIERLDLDGVEVSVGGRYDHLSQEAFLDESAYARHRARGTLEPDACSVAGEVASCPTSFDTGSVTLGGAVPLGEALVAKLDLSTASRFPTIDELYINGTAPTMPVLAIGDPSLGAETSYGASATLDLDDGWISGQASVFGSFIDDYIYFAPELDPDGAPIFDVLIRGAYPRFSYRPVDATFWGGEASVLLRFEPFELESRAAWVRGRDVDGGGDLEWVPPDRSRVALTYHPPGVGVLERPFATVSGDYVAEQTHYDSTTDLSSPPPAYALVGLAVGSDLEIDGQRFRASIEVENLLDERYRDYTSLLKYFADEPGRQVFLRLGATVDLM